MDQRTRKLMTMHKALPPRDSVDRLYVSRKEEGTHGVVVIVIGNGHSDTSSNPGRDWLHFT